MPRVSGVTIPLFSLRTRSDWGIGQITDLPACAAWFATAGQRLLQVLPAHELAGGETSPYGALSAFALDPIYIDVTRVAELDGTAIARALGDEGERELARLRSLPRVDYSGVRALKQRVLSEAFARFRRADLAADTARGQAFRAFVDRESHWLRDYALYAALRTSHDGYGWASWPAHERDRSPETLALAADLRDAGGVRGHVALQMYLQWLAHDQWEAARAELRTLGVALMGDLPFIVGSESADVWAHRDQFRSDVTLGAPPDDFSADGQSWGLPAYDWAAMDRDSLGWLRARAKHAAKLYDRFRIDHVVGFFRQWVRREGERGTFYPGSPEEQRARGESVLRAMLESAGKGAVIAEDLGVIPPFVRETMQRLEVPGYKVLPWERDESFMPRDPRGFPELSVATWSTHDTLPITQWWYELHDWERERLARLDGIALDLPERDRELALFALLASSRSELTLFLAQELLGDKSRINTPGTVNGDNWTWRIPRPIEDYREDAGTCARFEAVRAIAARFGRV